jgi:hypothetical protein
MSTWIVNFMRGPSLHTQRQRRECLIDCPSIESTWVVAAMLPLEGACCDLSPGLARWFSLPYVISIRDAHMEMPCTLQ